MVTADIDLRFKGHYAEVVLGMYIDSALEDDVDQVAWNLCECDDTKKSVLIGKCELISSSVLNQKASIVITLSGTDKTLQEKVIQEYIDGFLYYIRPTQFGLQSRTGDDYNFSLIKIGFSLQLENKESV